MSAPIRDIPERDCPLFDPAAKAKRDDPLPPVVDTLGRMRRALAKQAGTLFDIVTLPREVVQAAVDHLHRLTDPIPRARAGDPETSRAAARRAATTQGEQHATILRMLAAPGTAREIAGRTQLVQSRPCKLLEAHEVGKRLAELVRAGVIERTPEVRDGMHVYRLTGAGSPV